MEDCIFCRIVSGAAEASIFYQDELVVGFLDINPVTPGHALIVPKQHAVGFSDLDEATGRHIWSGSAPQSH